MSGKAVQFVFRTKGSKRSPLTLIVSQSQVNLVKVLVFSKGGKITSHTDDGIIHCVIPREVKNIISLISSALLREKAANL